MGAMADLERVRMTRARGRTLVMLSGSLTFLLLGMGLRRWAVAAFFLVFIPGASIEAFLGYRRKRMIDDRPILDGSRESN